MKSHLYKFTVEHLEDSKGCSTESDSLTFEARNHDDLFKIVEAMKGKQAIDEEDTAAFAIGLKLFSEVMLKNRNNELFRQFKPHFVSFMKELKKA